MWIHNETGELINTAYVAKFTNKLTRAANGSLTSTVVALIAGGGEEVIVRHDVSGELSTEGGEEWCLGVIETIGAQLQGTLYPTDYTTQGDGPLSPPCPLSHQNERGGD